MLNEEVLECQDCGRPVLELDPEDVQKVAANPYNYIVYCNEHGKE